VANGSAGLDPVAGFAFGVEVATVDVVDGPTRFRVLPSALDHAGEGQLTSLASGPLASSTA